MSNLREPAFQIQLSCVSCGLDHKGGKVIPYSRLNLIGSRILANSCSGTVKSSTSSQPDVPKLSAAEEQKVEGAPKSGPEPQGTPLPQNEPPLAPPQVLKPLTSLRWPYVPEAPSYPDPLSQDEVKPLQLPQYEAIGRAQIRPSSMTRAADTNGSNPIATSINVREVLTTNPRLKDILRSIDALQGSAREQELEKILGVAVDGHGRPVSGRNEEEMKALRALAEVVEHAVRGEKAEGDVRGLDWGDEA
ncbi:hypothetical protein FRC01_008963 [Tulasnella sp. 417]|nr:hypothetical protein FRC01_008963 [Tulasnella sp. 417]